MRTMADEKQYITKEKLNELTEELKELKTTKRAQVAEQLEYARSLGDLKENAEYKEARDMQATLEARIATIEDIIANAEIIKEGNTNEVTLGSSVTITKVGDKIEFVYKIVGSTEADIKERKISHLSPLGSAMMGKKKGQFFEFETPNGTVKYKIIEIN